MQWNSNKLDKKYTLIIQISKEAQLFKIFNNLM